MLTRLHQRPVRAVGQFRAVVSDPAAVGCVVADHLVDDAGLRVGGDA